MTEKKKPIDRLKEGLDKAAEKYTGRWNNSDTWTKAHTTLGKGYEQEAQRPGYHKDTNSRAAKKATKNKDK